MFGLYIEYIKHFGNIFAQFETLKSEHVLVQNKLKKLIADEESADAQQQDDAVSFGEKAAHFVSAEEAQCKEQLKTLRTNMINMCLELLNLLRLSKRMGFFCPIEYVSEPFVILYACHKERVASIK